MRLGGLTAALASESPLFRQVTSPVDVLLSLVVSVLDK